MVQPVSPSPPNPQLTQQFLSSVLSQSGPSALPYSEDTKWLIHQHLVSLSAAFPSLEPRLPPSPTIAFPAVIRGSKPTFCGMPIVSLTAFFSVDEFQRTSGGGVVGGWSRFGSREESQMGPREGGGDIGFPSFGLESHGDANGFFSAQTPTTRSAISDNFLLPSLGR